MANLFIGWSKLKFFPLMECFVLSSSDSACPTTHIAQLWNHYSVSFHCPPEGYQNFDSPLWQVVNYEKQNTQLKQRCVKRRV